MQYADVAVKLKTAQIDLFTYSVPAKVLPYLALGSIVEVPFGQRKLLAIVINIKKSVRKIDPAKLRPISKVVDPMPVLDQNRLKLAQQIKDYYISSLGKVIFAMIPEPARRQASEMAKELTVKKKTPKKPVMIIGSKDYRLAKYEQIIAKTKKINQPVLILFSSINSAIAKKLIAKYSKAKVYHANLKTSEKYQIWKSAQKQEIEILIGTRQALFLPNTDLGAIIVDQATTNLYKNDQEPFYDIKRVARLYSQLSGTRLFYGDFSFPLELWPIAKQRNWQIIKEKKQEKIINIVNLNKEKSLLSQPLTREISQAISSKEKTLLFLNRKGKQRIAICTDCDHIQYLEIERDLPTNCPNCKKSNIKLSSLGTKGLVELVQREFPNAKILRLDSQTKTKQNNEIKKKDFDILVATALVFDQDLNFDLSIAVLPEISLAFPAYNTWENSFYQIAKLVSLGKRSLIQSFKPKRPLISFAVQNDYQNFFKAEFQRRKKYAEPPFKTMLKIYTRQQEPKKALHTLTKDLANWAAKENISIAISPVIKPILGKWPFIILKADPKLPHQLTKKLLGLNKFKIDRDPKDLF